MLTALLALVASLAMVAPAPAATVHEITGEWAQELPETVQNGDALAATWRLNVNDDAAAPGNEPVDDVTFEVTLGGARFESLPRVCLTEGVVPVSTVSEDGTTLLCNIGTVDQGTAVVTTTGVVVDAVSGEAVSATGSLAGASVTLPEVTVDNQFAMDIRWQTNNGNTTRVGSHLEADFQWSLLHGTGADPGPDSVSYTITPSTSTGSTVTAAGCDAYTTRSASGHPYSGGDHPADRIAPFVDECSLTNNGNGTFTLTLSGIDYSRAQVPTHDSTGSPLPLGTEVVAAGQITLRVQNAPNSGNLEISVSAPEYVSPTGDAVADDPANNTSATTWTSGVWSAGWRPGHTGQSLPSWSDTYRVAPGTTVQQNVSILYGRNPGSITVDSFQLCLVLDTRHVEYVGTQFGSGAVWDNALREAGVTYSYYTGGSALLDPQSASYDPNQFVCNGSAGWTTEEPDDSSTVRAVRATVPSQTVVDVEWSTLRALTVIKDDTPVGTDVWSWAAHTTNTGGWAHPNRGVAPSSAPASGVLTPDARYPFAAAGRDILRTIGAQPSVDKTAEPVVALPGDTISYTLGYAAEGTGAIPETVDGFVLEDVLPVGMTYVPGSAPSEPQVATNAAGRQVLTWALDGVPTNTGNTLSYTALVDEGVEPGSSLTNTVSASYGGTTSPQATATVTVSTDGWTQIVKTADQAFIPNLAGDGVGEGSWTVTVRSQDPTTQAFTDVIDILPYVGDGRGTDLAGSYTLTGVEAVDGATVYYTTAAPDTLSDDPADPSNGQAGDITGSTAGWSTDFTPDATAVRVIGPELPAGSVQQFTVAVLTDGAEAGDVLVNRAQGRAAHTELVMRTSADTMVAQHYSASLKKYVQDDDGEWWDANETEEYPAFRIGDEVTYRIVVENTGGGTLTNVVVEDDQQPALGAFTVESLAPGESETHEYTVTLDESSGGSLVNTASATVDTPPDMDVPPVIPPDPAGIDVVNYSVTKSADPESGETVSPGDTVRYTVTVTQEGSVPAEAWFRDALADVLDDATYTGDVSADIGSAVIEDGVLSWEGTVPVGGSATVTYSVTVGESAALGDATLTNVVLSPGCEGECTTTHPVGWFTYAKDSVPAPGSDVQVGDTIRYTVTVDQEGPGAVGDASVADDLRAVLDQASYNGDVAASAGEVTLEDGMLDWSGDLLPGGVVTISYSVTVTGDGDGTLTNVVTSDDPRGGCEGACTTEHVYGWFDYAKDSDPAPGATVQVGDTVSYTVTVAQGGPGAVEGASVVDDLSAVLDDATYNEDVTASAGEVAVADGVLTWSGDLDVDEVVTITYSVTVTGDGDGTLTNVVTSDDPRGGCEGACTTEHVYGWFTYAKDSDPASGTEVQLGDTVVYTVTVAHGGPGAVEAATVVDDLSAVLDDATYNDDVTASAGEVAVEDGALTWSGDLDVDEVVTISYSVTVTGEGDGTLANVVTSDDPRGGCEGECTTEHRYGWFGYAKDSLPAPGSDVQVGDTVTYTVTVTHDGPGAVEGASVVDDLSAVLDDATYNDDVSASAGEVAVENGALTWSGDLDVDEVVTITYSVTVVGGGDGTLANVVASDDPRGECDGDCTTEHRYGWFTYAKDSAPEPGTQVEIGDTVTYTVTVAQGGPGAVEGASVVDDLSAVLDDASYNEDVTASAGEVAVADGVLTWSGDLGVDEVVTITYSVTVTGDGDGTLTNVVTSDDPRGGCEGACTTEHRYGWFTYAKNSDPAPGSDLQHGEEVTYTLTVTQHGAAGIAAASIVDDLSGVLDDATYGDDVEASAGEVAVEDGVLTWSGDLGVDEVVTITYSVVFTGGGDEVLRNVVTTQDPRGECEGLCAVQHPGGWFTYAKDSDPASGSDVQVGDTVEYTLTVTQRGEGSVEGASLTDDLSAVLDDATYNDDVAASAGEVTVIDGELDWSGDLAVGDVVTITYSVTVTGEGDGTLTNIVTSDHPRGECDDTCRTEHPVPPVPTPPAPTPPAQPEQGALAQTGVAAAVLVGAASALLLLGALLVRGRRTGQVRR